MGHFYTFKLKLDTSGTSDTSNNDIEELTVQVQFQFDTGTGIFLQTRMLHVTLVYSSSQTNIYTSYTSSVNEGPKNGWLIDYYEYDIVLAEEIFKGSIRVSDTISGYVELPDEVRDYEYIVLKCTNDVSGNGYDILTNIFDEKNKTYSVFVKLSTLETNHIQINGLTTLLYNRVFENQDTNVVVVTLYEQQLEKFKTTFGITNVYEDPYATSTAEEDSLQIVKACLEIETLQNVVELVSDKNLTESIDHVYQKVIELIEDTSGQLNLQDEVNIEYILNGLLQDSNTENLVNNVSNLVSTFSNTIIDSSGFDSSGSRERLLVNLHKDKQTVISLVGDGSGSVLNNIITVQDIETTRSNLEEKDYSTIMMLNCMKEI